MEPRLWHQNYPVDMPIDIMVEHGLTLHGIAKQAFLSFPDHVAYSCLGVDVTYRETDRLSYAFASWLKARGYSAGDAIALMLPNSLVYPICALGVLRAGMTVVSVNPMYTARELTHQLRDSGARAIVVDEKLATLIEQVKADTVLEIVVHASVGQLYPTGPDWAFRSAGDSQPASFSLAIALQEGLEIPFAEPRVDAESIAFLQYTGGTTGVSKGAALSHACMVANVIQQTTWSRDAFVEGNTSCITPLPLYHVFPINIMFLLLRVGGTNRLMPNPRDLDQLFAEMARKSFHVMPGVNTLFNGLLASGKIRREDFSETRAIMGAGASVMGAVAQRWLDATGVPLSEGYGLTECGPGVTFNVLNIGWNGSIGVPFPSTDVQIIDAAGMPVGSGIAGELCVKGPQVFGGYWNRPEETARVFTEDGWFKTGDVATMDERGMLYIVDRVKDMILVSAFNVYPNEIEGVVSMLPEVVECACVGVPDERSGEAPHLFVVRKDASLTLEQIIAHCRANLTAYKIPRHVTFVDVLPKSPVGKILRRELRASIAASAVAT